MADGGAGKFGTEDDGDFRLTFERGAKSGELLGDAVRQFAFTGGEPAHDVGFLSIGNGDKLRGLALEFNFASIQQVQLGVEMADAGANLPADKRILLRWTVADDENGARFVELLHGERGIGGTVAQRGNEAGVISSAVMIDVIGAESGAAQALEEIVFFVGGAVAADEADGIGPVGGVNFFQPGGSGLRGFFPGDGIELAVFAEQRLLDAFWMTGEIKAEAALHAEKILIDAGEVAVIGAQNFVVADDESCFAAVGAVGADGGDVFHFPGAGFVTIGAAGERADGANVNAHAAFFAIEVVAAIRNDDGVGAAHADAEGFYVHTFVADAHAAEAENAAGGVVVDEVRPLFLGAMNFFFDEAAGVRAVAEDHVLQFALAAFIADRAIERVIGQQKFKHVLARVADLFGGCANDHAFADDKGASGLQLGHFIDFDEAHAAGGLQR